MSSHIKRLTFCALMAALTAVCAQITVPMPNGVPVTLQVFAVALTGYLLGAKYGAVTMLVYLLLGAVGVPVFSQFRGGVYMLVGKTGGYLWGFLPMTAVCGLAALSRAKGKWRRALPYLWGVPALLICHLCGTLQVMALAGGGFWALLMVYSVPYLVKDLICVAVAALMAVKLRPQLEKYLAVQGKKAYSEEK